MQAQARPSDERRAMRLTTRWGFAVDDPSAAQLAAALAELDIDEREHPDCWLAVCR